MLLLLIGCIMPKDPSISPEIEDFYFDDSMTQMEVDSGDQEAPPELESTLDVSVDREVLFVVHNNVSLPCGETFEPTVEIADFVFTVTYTKEEDSDCLNDYTLEYSIDVSGMEAGNYLLEAHGDSAEFLLE